MKVSVLAIAEHARLWAEKTAKKEGFPSDLNGFCARASVKLFNLLKAASYDPIIGCAHGHVYVILEGQIIDLTATQFPRTRSKKVFIKNVEDIRDQYQYQSLKIFDNPDELALYQKREGWPKTQIGMISKES